MSDKNEVKRLDDKLLLIGAPGNQESLLKAKQSLEEAGLIAGKCLEAFPDIVWEFHPVTIEAVMLTLAKIYANEDPCNKHGSASYIWWSFANQLYDNLFASGDPAQRAKAMCVAVGVGRRSPIGYDVLKEFFFRKVLHP